MRAIADVLRIEAKYSRYRDDSVTPRSTARRAARAVAIDAETAALLRYADRCFALSGGRFDITSGVLRRAWDFKREPPRVPTATRSTPLRRARSAGQRVEWDERSMRLPRAGMEIDFGGIGKEYAADRAATILQRARHRAWRSSISAATFARSGRQPDGTPWRVGIRHPREPRRRAIARLRPRDGARRDERRLRALFRGRRPALLPHARRDDRLAGRALAVGQRRRRRLRRRGQLRDDRDAARQGRRSVPGSAGRRMARRRSRRRCARSPEADDAARSGVASSRGNGYYGGRASCRNARAAANQDLAEPAAVRRWLRACPRFPPPPAAPPTRRSAPVRSARARRRLARFDEPLPLACGRTLAALRARLRDLRHAQRRRAPTRCSICHALNASHHVAGYYADDPTTSAGGTT